MPLPTFPTPGSNSRKASIVSARQLGHAPSIQGIRLALIFLSAAAACRHYALGMHARVRNMHMPSWGYQGPFSYAGRPRLCALVCFGGRVRFSSSVAACGWWLWLCHDIWGLGLAPLLILVSYIVVRMEARRGGLQFSLRLCMGTCIRWELFIFIGLEGSCAGSGVRICPALVAPIPPFSPGDPKVWLRRDRHPWMANKGSLGVPVDMHYDESGREEGEERAKIGVVDVEGVDDASLAALAWPSLAWSGPRDTRLAARFGGGLAGRGPVTDSSGRGGANEMQGVFCVRTICIHRGPWWDGVAWSELGRGRRRRDGSWELAACDWPALTTAGVWGLPRPPPMDPTSSALLCISCIFSR